MHLFAHKKNCTKLQKKNIFYSTYSSTIKSFTNNISEKETLPIVKNKIFSFEIIKTNNPLLLVKSYD